MSTEAGSANRWQLAQINVGRLVAPKGDPRVQPFFDALDRINSLAELAPGFIWRLQTEAGNATNIQPTSDPLFIVNLSVWSDADSLFNFVYRSAHTPEMARRREYFQPLDGAYQALWWIHVGRRPTIDEGLSRLRRLDQYGPTPQAFTFKVRFPAPGQAGPPIEYEAKPMVCGASFDLLIDPPWSRSVDLNRSRSEISCFAPHRI